MSSLAVAGRPSTGDALLARESDAPDERRRHTELVYSQVQDLSFEAALYAFDVAFGARRNWSQALTVTAADGTADSQPMRADSSTVEVIDFVADRLGVPVQDVLAGAGIKKRTFHHWKSHPGTRPRLESQGDLWALAHSVEILIERLGGRLARWMAESPSRRTLLRRGSHQDLVREATAPQGISDAAVLRREREMAAGYFDEVEDRPADSDTAERPGVTPARVAAVSRPRR